MSQVFRYSEDKIPVAFFVAYFFLDVYFFFTANSVLFLFVWMLFGILPKACICAWNHHHQHVPTFKISWMNRVLEFVFSFHTGITSDGWTLHHVLGHHLNYLDQMRDESRWQRRDGSKMGVIEYSTITALTGYPRAFIVGLKHPKYLLPFASMTLIVLSVLALMLWYSFLNALFIFVLPMIISFYITAWHTYYHHAGLESEDDMEASYNIVQPLYNFCTGNLGYHTAHHHKMGVHWSKLPKLHEEIKHNIPKGLYRKPPPPFKWFPSREVSA